MEYYAALKRNEILASYNMMNSDLMLSETNRQKEKILYDSIYECDTAIYNKKYIFGFQPLFL